MVEQVYNYSEKSFKDYTGPNEKFGKSNIIFGYNGRGKTSLANGIIDEFLKDTQNTENEYRFYDKNYIANNLLLEQKDGSKIKGVIANFGKKDIIIENQITELESKIVAVKKIEDEIDILAQKARKEVDRIHDLKKGNASISKKSKGKNIEEVISLYMDDIKEAKRIENDEEKLIAIKGDNALENEKNKIDKIVIPQISNTVEDDLKSIKSIFVKSFDDITIPSSKIISWISEGLAFHSDGEKCKFCGNNVELGAIKEKIDKFNNNEKQKDSVFLSKFNDKLKQIISNIDSVLLLKDIILSNFENDMTQNLSDIEKNRVILNDYQTIINKKLDSIEKIIEFDEITFKTAINETVKSCENIISERNRMINNYNTKEMQINTLVKGAIGLEISKNTFINDTLSTIKEKTKLLKQSRTNNDNCRRKIEELKKSKSNTLDFANHMSSILSLLEINLKLEVEDDNYIIKQTLTNDICRIEDISEGEQNLLALLYFYYELFNDNEQKQLKGDIKMIVIDDPIASVDDINKMYVLELIKRISTLENVQIFIFTHVWEDFCNICYGKSNNENYKFFEVKKDTNGSFLTIAKTNETPYQHNFKDIYMFSQKHDCADMSDCEIYHYPNIMRTVLEEFLSFKVKNHSPTSNNINSIRLALCGEHPSANDEIRLGTLLNVCNILSHKASRNPDEILKSARFLMNKIESADKVHFTTMIN